MLDRLSLMGVEPGDAPRLQRALQPLVERGGKRRVLRRNGRQASDGRHVEIRRVGEGGTGFRTL